MAIPDQPWTRLHAALGEVLSSRICAPEDVSELLREAAFTGKLKFEGTRVGDGQNQPIPPQYFEKACSYADNQIWRLPPNPSLEEIIEHGHHKRKGTADP